jgi:hypothetical protein
MKYTINQFFDLEPARRPMIFLRELKDHRSCLDMAPTLFTSCNALPPEGAAAPAARQSRFCGPCLQVGGMNIAMFLVALQATNTWSIGLFQPKNPVFP